MNREAYELQPCDVPQPKLLDADPVTTVWPMPPVRKWEPTPVHVLMGVLADIRERMGL